MSSYSIIGLMSGTSMDGLDIAWCKFENRNEKWHFSIQQTSAIEYPKATLDRLKKSTAMSPVELLLLDKELGQFYGKCVNDFLLKFNIRRDEINAIASHGHTIFHQPEKGFTHQIGCGDTLAFQTGINVINDFRQKDVIAGGQGAPLVPIGDLLLFSGRADAFLNIGGFCNISFPDKGLAFDICPGNLPLNILSEKLGLSFDAEGEIAKRGTLNQKILSHLNGLNFYSESGPKSLGTEWLNKDFLPILSEIDNVESAMRTCAEHITFQINSVLEHQKVQNLLITGGGAKNTFLIERLKQTFKGSVIIPDNELIDYKEAVIFAFLGALYLHKTPNTLTSVTGANRNVIGGVLHIPD